MGAQKGPIWAETEPATEPVADTSSREASTSILLDRGWFLDFWDW